MGTTANRSYPYPDPADPADMAGALQALAEAVDTDVQSLSNSVTAPPLSVFSGDSTSVPTPGVATPANYSIVNYSNGAGSITDGGNSFTVSEAAVFPAPDPGLGVRPC
jgi:hypothetical protein